MEPFTDLDFMKVARDRLRNRIVCMCLSVALTVLLCLGLIRLWVVYNFDVGYLDYFLYLYVMIVVVLCTYGLTKTFKDYHMYLTCRQYGILPTSFRKIEQRDLWSKFS